jgi:alpha-L-fucosidase 2
MTSHNPNLDIYNADAANALPGVLSEALVYTRPGLVELLPAVPEQLAKGTITGVRGRNQVRVDSLSWDLPGRSVTVTLTSAVAQAITLISRRGIASITTSATVASSPLGPQARVISLPAGSHVQVTVDLPATASTGPSRLVNRRSGAVLDVSGGSTADGAKVIQWPWSGSANQQWRLLPNRDGSFRLSCARSGKVLDSPGGSGQGAALVQWADNGGTNQWWTLVPATSGYHRLVNVGNGWCVDVEGGSTANGAGIVQRPVSGESSQEWQIVGV